MIQESFLFSYNENNNRLKDKNNFIDFIPIALNDPKDIILDNIIGDNYSFFSNDEFELSNYYSNGIEGNKNNASLNSKNNIFINTFPEKSIGLVSNNTSEEFRKIKISKALIFGIKKDKIRKKVFQIKRKRKRKSISSTNKKVKCSGIMANKEDKYYPFNEPKGLISVLNVKFYTKKYSVKDDGKIRKIPKGRKFKSDDIRKKIKSRFHKELKNILNKNLKKCGSKKFFDNLPQCFISSVSKINNSQYLNLTFKELLSIDFSQNSSHDDCLTNKIAYKKYLKNKEILNYLEQNPEISKLSGFKIVKDKKYKDLLKNYFNSAQFEQSILQLKKEKESSEYIIKYITKAKNYVDFYSFEKLN